MRRVYLLASVLALAAGNLCANSALTLACSLNVSGLPGPFSGLGGVGGNGCFSTSFSNVTTLDSVNWGAPTETSGQSGLGDATPGNSFPIGVLNPVQYRTATTAGDQVTVQLPATYQGTATSVTRADNFGLQWNGSAWVAPGTPGTQNLAGFPGHFNSAVIPGSAAGDHLLELTNGGPLELSFLGTATGPVLGVWFQMASLAGQNSLFVAEVQAFDKDGNSIGTYTLTESGAYGSGGQCASLSFSPPLPCNDAP